MAHLQLLDLVKIIVFLKLVTSSPRNFFDNLKSDDDKIFAEKLLSLMQATDFEKEKELIDEQVSFSWCKNQQLPSSLDLSQKRKFPSKINSSTIICLDLATNEIGEVKNLNFSKVPNLEYLNLGQNKIQLREFPTIQHVKIRTLILNDNYQNPLSTFDSSSDEIYLFFQLPNLETLSLRNVTFNKEKKLIFNTTSKRLRHLILSDNKITALKFLFETKTLTHLEAENCQLKEYSSSSNQESLVYLSLNGNYFPYNNLSLDFQYNSNLKFLSLSNCALYYFDQTILESNAKLRYLDLSRNILRFLSNGTFDSNTALEFLNLNSNRLAKVPNLRKLANLQKLFLGDNKIRVLENYSFSGLMNLETLSLRGNKIYSIHQNSFDELFNLQILDLSGNSLKNFQYHSASSLRYLLLANNLISSTSNIEIANNVKFEYLDLVQNSKLYDKEHFSFQNVSEFLFLNFCRQRGIC